MRIYSSGFILNGYIVNSSHKHGLGQFTIGSVKFKMYFHLFSHLLSNLRKGDPLSKTQKLTRQRFKYA